jgi:hypothetical protein
MGLADGRERLGARELEVGLAREINAGPHEAYNAVADRSLVIGADPAGPRRSAREAIPFQGQVLEVLGEP